MTSGPGTERRTVRFAFFTGWTGLTGLTGWTGWMGSSLASFCANGTAGLFGTAANLVDVAVAA